MNTSTKDLVEIAFPIKQASIDSMHETSPCRRHAVERGRN